MTALFRRRPHPRGAPLGQVEVDPNHRLGRGMVAYYLLGNSVADIVSRSAPWTPTNAPTLTPTQFGVPALTFNGTNQRATMSWQNNVAGVTGYFWDRDHYLPFTLSVWVYPTLASYGATRTYIWNNAGGSGSDNLGLYVVNANLGLMSLNNLGNPSTREVTPTTLQAWHNLVVTGDETTTRTAYFYIDGALQGTAGDVGNALTYSGSGTLNIANNNSANYFTGQILSVAMWQGVRLNDSAVAQLYAEPFAMLRPVQRRTYVFGPAAAPGLRQIEAMVLA